MNFPSKIFKVAALSAGIFLSATSSACADALDDCREILLSGTYTVKYENITPPPREALHEKFMMYSGNVEPPENPYTLYKPVVGIVTASGDKRYVETNTQLVLPNMTVSKATIKHSNFGGISGLLDKVLSPDKKDKSEYSTCTLTRNDEKFVYTRITYADKVDYVGKKKGQVEAVKIKKGFNSNPVDFGNGDMTRVLNALLPDDGKVEDTVVYKRAASGTLPNGLYYVDMKAVNPAKNVIFDAIRYYFDDGKLVKIEAGEYYRTKSGKLDGTRTIINVKEFTSDAETKYFKLPTELKDVTKRKTDAKGGGAR